MHSISTAGRSWSFAFALVIASLVLTVALFSAVLGFGGRSPLPSVPMHANALVEFADISGGEQAPAHAQPAAASYAELVVVADPRRVVQPRGQTALRETVLVPDRKVDRAGPESNFAVTFAVLPADAEAAAAPDAPHTAMIQHAVESSDQPVMLTPVGHFESMGVQALTDQELGQVRAGSDSSADPIASDLAGV